MGEVTWQDGVKDAENHGPRVKQLQTDAAKLGDAQPHKNVIGVKQAAKHLSSGEGLKLS